MNEWNGGGGGGGCGDGERSRVPYLIVVYCIDLIEMVSLFFYFPRQRRTHTGAHDMKTIYGLCSQTLRLQQLPEEKEEEEAVVSSHFLNCALSRKAGRQL